jgi:hypothetical protein
MHALVLYSLPVGRGGEQRGRGGTEMAARSASAPLLAVAPCAAAFFPAWPSSFWILSKQRRETAPGATGKARAEKSAGPDRRSRWAWACVVVKVGTLAGASSLSPPRLALRGAIK